MSNDNANDRMNNLWERACIGLLTLVVSYMGMAYKDVVNDVRSANDKIVLLQMDKVGKSDMREMEVRTNSRMDAGFSNLAQRIDSNQQDIMRQLQLYFGNTIKNRN
jgi:hypothetical protein